MSVSSAGIISEPVEIDDIKTALSNSSGDLETLCKASSINKWAMYKPEKIAELYNITLAQRKANYFGLTPKLNDKAKRTMFGYTGSDAQNIGDTGFTINDVALANLEWPYQKPTGTNLSPYRQTDFACDRARTYGIQGYRHKSRSPIFGWADWEIFVEDVNRILNTNIVDMIYNRETSAFEWKVDNILYDGTFYNSLSGRLSVNSASRFGGGGDDMIPVSWLLGGIDSENWRIGIGVFVESETKMHMFTSCYPLKYLMNVTTIMQQGPVFPALGTNQFLLKKMVSALGNSSYKTFTAIPILVRNCLQTVGYLDSGRQTLISFSGTNTLIYSVPSNFTTFSITLRNESKPTVQGFSVIQDSDTSDHKFVLAFYGNGQYAGGGSSASITPMLELGVFLADSQSFTGTKTIAYSVDYSYGLNNQSPRLTGHVEGEVSITNDDVITVGGITHIGKIIAIAPSLTVTSFTRLAYVN